jgi:predicted nucleotidyltransferase
MSSKEFIAAKRDEILRIAAKYGVSELRLIGSVARGEARPDSDIDLLVKWPPETSLLDHAGMMLELEELLGRKVDIASDGWLKPGVRETVYREAVPL